MNVPNMFLYSLLFPLERRATSLITVLQSRSVADVAFPGGPGKSLTPFVKEVDAELT